MPAFVRSGKNIAAGDADGRPSNHVVWMMLTGLDSAVSHERCGRVSWNAIFPPIALAHKLGGREGDGGVRRRKRVAAAVRSALTYGIFGGVGGAQGQAGGLPELKGAIPIAVGQGESSRRSRQNKLEDVTGSFDRACSVDIDSDAEVKQEK